MTEPASAIAAPMRKPMARARRLSLFERDVRLRLGRAALDLMLARASVLSEGRRSSTATGAAVYYGSTMVTIDLGCLGDELRESCDARLASEVAELMRGDLRLARRLHRVAEREAQRLAAAPLRVKTGAPHIRAQGSCIYLDIDVEE